MSIYKAGRPWKFDPTTGAGHRPPNSPGEYRMRDGSGCITYIGETNDLARRMREHIRSGKLPTGQGCGSTLEYMVADGRSTSRTRREHEQQSIEKHHPTLNRSKGGEGRPAGFGRCLFCCSAPRQKTAASALIAWRKSPRFSCILVRDMVSFYTGKHFRVGKHFVTFAALA